MTPELKLKLSNTIKSLNQERRSFKFTMIVIKTRLTKRELQEMENWENQMLLIEESLQHIEAKILATD
jgi:hypothetical protein